MKPQERIGKGDEAQRLRTIELYVSDHEGDLSQFAKDVSALFARTNEIGDIKIIAGRQDELLKSLSEEMKSMRGELVTFRIDVRNDFKDVRTSFRTVALAVGAAAITFAGLAVTIATQLPHG